MGRGGVEWLRPIVKYSLIVYAILAAVGAVLVIFCPEAPPSHAPPVNCTVPNFTAPEPIDHELQTLELHEDLMEWVQRFQQFAEELARRGRPYPIKKELKEYVDQSSVDMEGGLHPIKKELRGVGVYQSTCPQCSRSIRLRRAGVEPL